MSAYYFWSPTCGPCKVIKPAVMDLMEEFSTVDWHSIDTHNDSEQLAKKFGVTAVPTIVVVTDTTTERHSGTTMMGYYRILRNATRQ